MYEAEVNTIVESHMVIPVDIREKFTEYKNRIIARTVLPWGEHCTECMWPVCYSTCELFTPRKDGGCRLFIDGMVKVNNPGGLNNYLVKISFKRWGKLWALGNTRLFSSKKAETIESRNMTIGGLLQKNLLPGKIKKFLITKRQSIKNRFTRYSRKFNTIPHYFLLECYLPSPPDIQVSFVVYYEEDKTFIPYQHLITLTPGFNRIKIPVQDIAQTIDIRKPFKIDITPNTGKDGTILYLGFADFVLDNTLLSKKGKKCKCVVWDLDHTLWEGILIEDGIEKLKLKEGIADIIKELDARGILHSIASKNNEADGLAALKKCGLIDYFLFPQINWDPKSKSIASIARQLNIGIDSFIFIDDQPFEREEVKQIHPGITVYDACEYKNLPRLEECNVPVTPESKKRRSMYKQQIQREVEKDNFLGSYFEFLKDCHIQLRLFPLDEGSINRVYELAQRTNQMNFSGNRYEKNKLREIMEDNYLHTYVMECRDRFGEYGIIGFSIVDSQKPCLLDLMFSCRVQSKRVEHAYLSYILKKYLPGTKEGFFAHYRKTERNKPSGKVFYETGFKEMGMTNGVTLLCFNPSPSLPDGEQDTIPDDHLIEIIEQENYN